MKKVASVASTSTAQQDWDIPEEEELSSVVEESSEEEVDVGESSVTTRPKRSFGCMPAHPRNEHVDDKLRKKIREGELIDFKLMVPRARGDKPRKRFSLVDGFFEEVEDNDKNLESFYSWIDAFIVFMSIHLEFYPSDVQGLLRHFEIVKGFHMAGKDGIEYDFQFRRLKSRNADVVWGEYIAELAGDLRETKTSKKKANQPGRKSGRYCLRFNSAAGCKFGNTCRFTHKCKKCFSPDHPEYRCSKK